MSLDNESERVVQAVITRSQPIFLYALLLSGLEKCELSIQPITELIKIRILILLLKYTG